MSNHIHLIIGSQGKNKMQDIMRDLKKFTSQAIIKSIQSNPEESRREWMIGMFEQAGGKNSNNKRYQFWRQDNHPIELSTAKMTEQKLDYIHNNPVEAGLVLSPEEYLYSSAKNYYGLGNESLLDIIMVE